MSIRNLGQVEHEFSARIWIGDATIQHLETWCYELEPTDFGRRGVAEWAMDHIREMYGDSFLEMFNLDESKNWQILIKGTIGGHWCCGLDGDEWDEWMDVIEHQEIEVPDEYMKIFNHEQSH